MFALICEASTPNILQSTGKGQAYLGTGLTEEQARKIALNEAKRDALEKAGTYLESHTEITDYRLTKDQIITYTGSLLKIDSVEYKPIIIEGRFALKARVKVTIDKDELFTRIKELNTNYQLKNELIEQRRIADNLSRQLRSIQSENVEKDSIQRYLKKLSAEDIGNKAFREYLDEKYEEALKLYRIAVDKDPSNVYFRLKCAECLYKLGKFENAIDEANNVVSLFPDSVISYIVRASFFNRTGKSKLALKDLNFGISRWPYSSKLFYFRGITYLQYDTLKALTDFKNSIALDSTNIQSLTKVGDIYFKRNKFREAQKYHTKVYNIDSSSFVLWGWEQKAEGYRKKHDYTQALFFLKIAQKIGPTESSSYRKMAEVYLDLNDTLNSINLYNHYVSLSKDKTVALMSRSYFLNRIGRTFEAMCDLNQAIELDSTCYVCFKDKAELFYAKKDCDSSLYYYRKYYENIESSDSLSNYFIDELTSDSEMMLLDSLTKCSHAFSSLILEIDGKNVEALLVRAQSNLINGNTDETFQDLNSVIALEPANKDAFRIRADIYKRKGNLEKAILDYNRIIKMGTCDIETILNRAELFVVLEQFDLAIADYKFIISTYNCVKNSKNEKFNEWEREGYLTQYNFNRYTAYKNLAIIYYRNKQYVKSENILTKAITVDGYSASSLWILRAESRLALGNNIDAIHDFTSAIENDPQCDSRAFFGRGEAYYNLGEKLKAGADFNEYLRKISDSTDANDFRVLMHKMGLEPLY